MHISFCDKPPPPPLPPKAGGQSPQGDAAVSVASRLAIEPRPVRVVRCTSRRLALSARSSVNTQTTEDTGSRTDRDIPKSTLAHCLTRKQRAQARACSNTTLTPGNRGHVKRRVRPRVAPLHPFPLPPPPYTPARPPARPPPPPPPWNSRHVHSISLSWLDWVPKFTPPQTSSC
jgi:hypothetical protein